MTRHASLKVNNYGDLLAQVNNLELVSYEEVGEYQGEYVCVLKDEDRVYIYIDSFGSCSGCDWLEDTSVDTKYIGESQEGHRYTIRYKDALDYVGDTKPYYIVPAELYDGFSIKVLLKAAKKVGQW